jgi:hypothetical protein
LEGKEMAKKLKGGKKLAKTTTLKHWGTTK